MDEKLRQLLDEIPERPPRSKLEPHAEVIRELRRKRRTYQEIAAFFREHLQLSVAPSTIHDFVKTRTRQARKRTAVPELPRADLKESVSEPVPTPPVAASPVLSGDIREHIRSVRAQPLPTKQEPPRFEFDPLKPLTLKPKEK